MQESQSIESLHLSARLNVASPQQLVYTTSKTELHRVERQTTPDDAVCSFEILQIQSTRDPVNSVSWRYRSRNPDPEVQLQSSRRWGSNPGVSCDGTPRSCYTKVLPHSGGQPRGCRQEGYRASIQGL